MIKVDPGTFLFSPLGFVYSNPYTQMVHLHLIRLLLTPTQELFLKKEQGESTSQKILEGISYLKTKRKPGKSPKEQNELGGETGKPVL